MAHLKRAAWLLVTVSAIAVAATWQVGAQGGAQAPAQAAIEPINEAPNPYKTIEGWAKMPEGREWGSTSAVDIDKDGKSIWVAERCGKARTACVEPLPQSPDRRVVAARFRAEVRRDAASSCSSFGAGMIIFPHGIHVDRDGNIWVTDGQDNFPRAPAAARAADAPPPPPPAKPVGHQIFKFSPDGQAADDARQGRRQSAGRDAGPVVVLSAERHHHERRRARSSCARGTATARASQRAHQVRSHRQVHQGDRQARQRRRAVHAAARAGVGFEGPAVRRRSIEQPHPDSTTRISTCSTPAGSNTAGSAACGSTGTTCSTPRTPSPGSVDRRRTARGSAASASAASGTARTARSSSSFPTPRPRTAGTRRRRRGGRRRRQHLRRRSRARAALKKYVAEVTVHCAGRSVSLAAVATAKPMARS